MSAIGFDIAHLLAGSLVLVSFLELYQDRLYALLNIYALMPWCWPPQSPGKRSFRTRRICT